MFPKMEYGKPIPYKVWMKATDILADYIRAGQAWVEAGRIKGGPIYDMFCKAEESYNQMADAIWFASWTPEQRKEWDGIYTR